MNQPSRSEFRPSDEAWETAPVRERDREQSGFGVPHLLRQLTGEVTTLFSKEVSLARAEMREAVHEVKSGLVSLMSGSIVLLAGFIVLLMAAVYGLSTTMELELWMSALIVGGVVSLIGLIMVVSGKNKLGADALKPHRTADSLREDRAAMKHAVKGGRP